MVPVQTEEMKDGEPMRVCVEHYGFLPTDKAAFKGEIPEIKNMVPFAPFDFYIKRKLYVHNMGHAASAYLGDILGIEYIYEVMDIPEVRIIVHNAMLESAAALSQKYGVELSAILMHINDLLFRFTNAALKDTCSRVGGDPARKLAKEDRLIGAALLAAETGGMPVYIAAGAAAALIRYLKESGREQTAENAANVLSEVSGLGDCELKTLIIKYYSMLAAGTDLKALIKVLDADRAERSGDII